MLLLSISLTASGHQAAAPAPVLLMLTEEKRKLSRVETAADGSSRCGTTVFPLTAAMWCCNNVGYSA